MRTLMEKLPPVVKFDTFAQFQLRDARLGLGDLGRSTTRQRLGKSLRAIGALIPARAWLLLPVLLVIQSPARAAQPYNFTKIADTNGPFLSFAPGGSLPDGPSINDAGSVVFWAALKMGGEGVFVGSGASLITIADSVSGNFREIRCCPAINNAGTVAFRAYGITGIEGIFARSGGPFITIADSSASLNGFVQPSINDSGTVTFRVFIGPGDSGGVWIFKGNGGPLTPIANNRSGVFYELGGFPSINSAGVVAFEAGLLLGGQASGGPGLFVGNGGPLISIATSYLFTPGSPFAGFTVAPSINDSGTVAFMGSIEQGNGSGIFLGSGGPITTVGDSNGPLNNLRHASIDDRGKWLSWQQ
jgi:hypothetical protein